MWGSLQLTEADIVARGEDGADAWRLLRNARGAAERVDPGRNDYWEAFGPANVGVYEIMVALESGDPVEALRIADTVEVDELPSAESRARFCIQVAREYALSNDDAATVMLLLEAERRSRTPELRGLTERLGVGD